MRVWDPCFITVLGYAPLRPGRVVTWHAPPPAPEESNRQVPLFNRFHTPNKRTERDTRDARCSRRLLTCVRSQTERSELVTEGNVTGGDTGRRWTTTPWSACQKQGFTCERALPWHLKRFPTTKEICFGFLFKTHVFKVASTEPLAFQQKIRYAVRTGGYSFDISSCRYNRKVDLISRILAVLSSLDRELQTRVDNATFYKDQRAFGLTQGSFISLSLRQTEDLIF